MSEIFKSGTFITGCNYWASHSGTAMWMDWRPEIIDCDFAKLSEAGMKVIRVFPLWTDFQPIQLLRSVNGLPREYRIGEEPLSDDAEGLAGVSKASIAKFDEFVKIANKHDIKLIIGLLTGWMSGRLFVPPALEGLNILIDPCALMWEIRFVSYFVKRYKDESTIIAWDLGNECNCLAEVNTSDQAWTWSASITNAIRASDSTRPVISGMHSLFPDSIWSIQDQAEILDILTTHPYSYYTPHCDQDPLNTMRTELHPAAATLFYRGIGGKPCFVEELGTLGPMFGNDAIAADFIRNNLFTLWAHDCLGLFWWCANEQSHLINAPYDWNASENELGLFHSDGSQKPVLGEFNRFAKFVDSFPYSTLPERIVDAICVLTGGQDTWGVALNAFVLSKQAGIDIEFQFSTQPLRDSKLYLLPSLKGDMYITKRRMRELLDKVKHGAVLYISIDDALLSPFSEYTGTSVLSREKQTSVHNVTFKHECDDYILNLKGAYKLILEIISADVLATDEKGYPAFTSNSYGLGKVFFLNYPVESFLMDLPGALHGNEMKPYWSIYKKLKDSISMHSTKVATCNSPFVGLTEHIVDEKNRILIAINYDNNSLNFILTIKKDWEIKDFIYGETYEEENVQTDGTRNFKMSMKKNDAIVFNIIKT